MPEIPARRTAGRPQAFAKLKIGDRLWIDGVPMRKLTNGLAVEVWTGKQMAVVADQKVDV